MTTIRRRPAALVLGVTLAMSGLLSSCSGLQPGAAVQVGESTITMDKIDELADGYCAAIEPQMGQGGLPAAIAMGDLRSGIAQQLAGRAVADEIASDFDVSPTSDYGSAMKTLEAQAASLPKDGRAAFVEVQSAATYIQNIVSEAARKDLVRSGTPSPTQAEISAHADELFKQYRASSHVSFDPRLGTSAAFEKQDGTLSVALSKAAKSTDAASLPAAQRCGG